MHQGGGQPAILRFAVALKEAHVAAELAQVANGSEGRGSGGGGGGGSWDDTVVQEGPDLLGREDRDGGRGGR